MHNFHHYCITEKRKTLQHTVNRVGASCLATIILHHFIFAKSYEENLLNRLNFTSINCSWKICLLCSAKVQSVAGHFEYLQRLLGYPRDFTGCFRNKDIFFPCKRKICHSTQSVNISWLKNHWSLGAYCIWLKWFQT